MIKYELNSFEKNISAMGLLNEVSEQLFKYNEKLIREFSIENLDKSNSFFIRQFLEANTDLHIETGKHLNTFDDNKYYIYCCKKKE